MLVLTRKPSESITIPELNITITVLETRHERVRIGIDAPGDIRVHRSEVWDRIQKEFQPDMPAEEKLAGVT